MLNGLEAFFGKVSVFLCIGQVCSVQQCATGTPVLYNYQLQIDCCAWADTCSFHFMIQKESFTWAPFGKLNTFTNILGHVKAKLCNVCSYRGIINIILQCSKLHPKKTEAVRFIFKRGGEDSLESFTQ